MYEGIYSKENQILSKGETKLEKNQFTKSLTSFHTKKILTKNIVTQNTIKKPGSIKQEKSVKNKKVYLSR